MKKLNRALTLIKTRVRNKVFERTVLMFDDISHSQLNFILDETFKEIEKELTNGKNN